MKQPSEQLLTVAKWVVQLRALDEHDLLLLKQIIQRIENPKVEPPREKDAIDRWGSGRKDRHAFRPSLVLWADWLEWCPQANECPGTQPAFWKRLKTKPWLRRGRTRFDGRTRNGWWGLKDLE